MVQYSRCIKSASRTIEVCCWGCQAAIGKRAIGMVKTAVAWLDARAIAKEGLWRESVVCIKLLALIVVLNHVVCCSSIPDVE